MKILLLLINCFFASLIITTIQQLYKINLGAIPTCAIYALFIFLYRIELSYFTKQNYKSKIRKFKNKPVDISSDGAWYCPVCKINNLYSKKCENCGFEPIFIEINEQEEE